MADQTVAVFSCPRCNEPYRVCRGTELELKAALETPERLDVAFEIKAVDVPGRTIEGYASVTGNVDGVADIIYPGAFKRTLAEHSATGFKNLDAYIGHQHRIGALPVGMPIAVREDAHGLATKTLIHNTSAGNDLLTVAAERMAAGKPLGMSIGYNPQDFKWETKDGVMVRAIKDLDLGEFSFTAMPANKQAVVTAIKAKNLQLKAATADPQTLATIAQIDLLIDEADELVDTLMDTFGIPDPDEIAEGEPEEAGMSADTKRMQVKVGRRFSTATASRFLDRLAAARKALDEIEADITADAAAAVVEAATTKSVAAITETVTGPFDLEIALAKVRGGLYA